MMIDQLADKGDNPRLDLKNKTFVGVIGPNYDAVAATVSDFFAFFRMPQVTVSIYRANYTFLTTIDAFFGPEKSCFIEIDTKP